MTDLDDLIARLRGFGPTSPASPAEVLAACREAAAALASLRDEVARKDAAIKRALDDAVADDFDEWFAGLRAALKHQ